MLTFAVVWRPKYSRSCHQSISARLNHLAEDSARHQHRCQLQNCWLFANKQIEQRADTQACISLQRHVAQPLWRWPSNRDQKQWAHSCPMSVSMREKLSIPCMHSCHWCHRPLRSMVIRQHRRTSASACAPSPPGTQWTFGLRNQGSLHQERNSATRFGLIRFV